MIRKILGTVSMIHLAIQGIHDRFWAFFYKKRFASCGTNVMIKPCTSNFKGFENIHIGSNVVLSRYATIYSTNANVFIGNNILAAPHLAIMSGNHSTDVLGYLLFAEKKSGKADDQDVILEDDLWFGINVTVLSGVRVGRGSVVAAGSVVNKSVPAYSIVGGVPAKVLKYRFSIDEIIEHEKRIYRPELRLTRETIVEQREKMGKK